MLYRKRDEEQEETIPPHPSVSRGRILGLWEFVWGKEKASTRSTVNLRFKKKLFTALYEILASNLKRKGLSLRDFHLKARGEARSSQRTFHSLQSISLSGSALRKPTVFLGFACEPIQDPSISTGTYIFPLETNTNSGRSVGVHASVHRKSFKFVNRNVVKLDDRRLDLPYDNEESKNTVYGRPWDETHCDHRGANYKGESLSTP